MADVDSRPEAGEGRSVRLIPVDGLLRYLAALRSFDSNVKLVLVVTAFRGMTIAALSTILNLYLYSLGYDARFIGVINGVNSLGVLVVSVPLGYLADRLGRTPVLLIGGVAYPLSILALSLVHSTPSIMVFGFIWGGVSSAYWVAGVPLLFASTRPDQRVQVFSVNSFLLWGIGPLGAFLSGQAVEIAARVLHVSASSTSALRYGMFFMVLLAALGALPYPFLREPKREEAVEREERTGRSIAALFLRLLIPDLVLAFGVGSIVTFSQLYFHVRFHLDAGPVGLIMAIGGLIAGIGTLSVPIVAGRWGNLRTAVRIQWGAVPLMALLAISMRLVLAVPAYWLVVTLRGMADPVYTAFIQERVPEQYRARLTGFYSVTYSIGFSLGPAASGQLQKVGGFTPAYLMGAGFYLAGATLLYLFFGRKRSGQSGVGT